MTFKTACVAVLLAAAVPATGTEALRLRVSPEMCVEPAWIVVRVTIEPDAENRVLEIVAESAEFLRSSRIQLDGANASRTSVFQYRDLPAGEYEVRGVVRGRDGRERAAARRTIRVLQ